MTMLQYVRGPILYNWGHHPKHRIPQIHSVDTPPTLVSNETATLLTFQRLVTTKRGQHVRYWFVFQKYNGSHDKIEGS
jgi:hypothetical protein